MSYPNHHQNSYNNNNQQRLNQNEIVDSDDDTLDQIYSFADFSEQSSKMKIQKWLPPEQESIENEINDDNHKNNFIYIILLVYYLIINSLIFKIFLFIL